MARRKKPENETPEQTQRRVKLETVANHASRSEKTAWNRKMDNLVALMAQLKPFQDQIIELEIKKMPILDQIKQLRDDMIKECVHPIDNLVVTHQAITCKFCNKKFGITQDE